MKSSADLTDPNIRDQGLQQVQETDVFALLLNTSTPFSYQLSATQATNDAIFFFYMLCIQLEASLQNQFSGVVRLRWRDISC